MNIFLSKKLASKRSYQDLSDHTGIHREYTRKLVINPGNHENLEALILIGFYLGMNEREVKHEWTILRKEELSRRVEEQAKS
jgi:hypothetical protein